MTSRGTIAVYYSPMMVAESGSFSPSAGKPAPVVSSWRQALYHYIVPKGLALLPRILALCQLAKTKNRPKTYMDRRPIDLREWISPNESPDLRLGTQEG